MNQIKMKYIARNSAKVKLILDSLVEAFENEGIANRQEVEATRDIWGAINQEIFDFYQRCFHNLPLK